MTQIRNFELQINKCIAWFDRFFVNLDFAEDGDITSDDVDHAFHGLKFLPHQLCLKRRPVELVLILILIGELLLFGLSEFNILAFPINKHLILQCVVDGIDLALHLLKLVMFLPLILHQHILQLLHFFLGQPVAGSEHICFFLSFLDFANVMDCVAYLFVLLLQLFRQAQRAKVVAV